MKTVKEVYSSYRLHLQALYDTNEVTALTELVLNELTGFSRAKLKAFSDETLSENQQASAAHILTELQTGKPVQYIVGHTEFYGLPFKVNSSVLIPRPETEELVEWIVHSLQTSPFTNPNLLDIGTGSGCIAVSLAKTLPGASVSAIDISAPALQTATENARLNQVTVNFIEADILQEQTASLVPANLAVMVSNPPYVTPLDKEQMHTNVTDFEPHTALFVPQNDPLIFYKAIADLATVKLMKDGMLFFEINEAYGQETVDMLSDKRFENIELRKDLFDKNRMVKAIWPR